MSPVLAKMKTFDGTDPVLARSLQWDFARDFRVAAREYGISAVENSLEVPMEFVQASERLDIGRTVRRVLGLANRVIEAAEARDKTCSALQACNPAKSAPGKWDRLEAEYLAAKAKSISAAFEMEELVQDLQRGGDGSSVVESYANTDPMRFLRR